MKMNEAIDQFRKYTLVTKTKGTNDYYVFYLNIIEEYMGEKEISSINNDTILNFIIYLRGKNTKMQNITINKFIGTIKTILRYSGDIALKFPKLKEQKKIIPTISETSIRKIFNYLQKRMNNKYSFRNYVLIRLLLDTGLRMNEVINLKVRDLDMMTASIHVKVTKTDSDRYVCFTDSTEQLLNKFLVVTKPKDLLFYDFATKKKLTTSSVECLLYRIKKELDIEENITPHKWRHTFATTFLKNGGDLETLRLLLGHTNLKTTQKYLHLCKQDIISNYMSVMRHTDNF